MTSSSSVAVNDRLIGRHRAHPRCLPETTESGLVERMELAGRVAHHQGEIVLSDPGPPDHGAGGGGRFDGEEGGVGSVHRGKGGDRLRGTGINQRLPQLGCGEPQAGIGEVGCPSGALAPEDVAAAAAPRLPVQTLPARPDRRPASRVAAGRASGYSPTTCSASDSERFQNPTIAVPGMPPRMTCAMAASVGERRSTGRFSAGPTPPVPPTP